MRVDGTLPPDQLAAAEALRDVARDEELKALVLGSEALYGLLLRAALRFVGGEMIAACVDVACELNAAGHAVEIDYVGESTRGVRAANEATAEFLRAVDAIDEHGLDASISLDLSHVGMAVDDELAVENARRIAEAAHGAGTELMINTEGSERTDRILAIHDRLAESFPNVGVTLQAYLHRTDGDLTEVLARPGRVRLVKGAYEEPPGAIRTRGEAVDAAF